MTSYARSRYVVPAVALVLALIAAMTINACSPEVTAPKPSVPAGAFSLADDFDDAPVGAAPAGWTGAGTTVAAAPTTVDHSLRTTSSATRAFAPVVGLVEVQARVEVRDWAADYDAMRVASSTGAVAATIGISRGTFVDRATGRGVAVADPGRWYSLRLVLNTTDRRYNLVLDGRQVITQAPFAAAAADIAQFSAEVRKGQAGTLWVDAVTARGKPAPSVGYLVFDQFNSDAVGSRPPGHQVTAPGGKVEVAAVPSAEDRSLLLAARKTTAAPAMTAQATSVRPFAAQTGTVVVQATVRTDETSGTRTALSVGNALGAAATIEFTGGGLAYDDGITAHRLVPVSRGEWYSVKLVLDVTARQLDIYIDGRRYAPSSPEAAVEPRWPFRSPAPAEVDRLGFGVGPGQTGAVRIDNLMVYRPVTVRPGTVVDVRDPAYGAVGDGVHDDTAALQRAIDKVPAGGTVYLSGGVFLTGSLRLHSDLTLWINRDAVLLGSTDDTAYPLIPKSRTGTPVAGGLITRGLVTAAGADHVRIEGGGTIDGNGRKPSWGVEGGTFRPAAILVTRGQDVTIRDLHVQNAAAWAVVPDEIDGLLVADVTIDSRIYANRDGLDIVDCHAVLVERVAVSSDDDAISFKSYSAMGVDGALVRLSTVGESVRANGVKFGTGSVTAFRNVVIEDVLIKHVDKAALVVDMVDGGVAANLSFRRITTDHALRAIFVLLGRRLVTDGSKAVPPRRITDVAFEGIVGEHLAEPSMLTGQREGGAVHSLSDILLSDVRQSVTGGVRHKPGTPAEYTGIYPESNIWTDTTTPPASGIYLRHVTGLTTRNTTVETEKHDVRPATTLQDVTAVTKY